MSNKLSAGLVSEAAVGFVNFAGHGVERSGLGARKFDQEGRARFGSALDAYRAVMVMDDFANDGKAQPGAIGLARADKGIEQSATNSRRDADAVVGDAHLE